VPLNATIPHRIQVQGPRFFGLESSVSETTISAKIRVSTQKMANMLSKTKEKIKVKSIIS
jgi:hypothetical protein